MPTSGGIAGRLLAWLVAFLAISAGFLYAFPQPNILYAVIVLLHAVGGVLAAVLLVPKLIRVLRAGSLSERAGWLLMAAGAIVGLVLIKTGTPRPEWNKLYLHIVLSVAGVGLLIAAWLGRRASAEARPIGSNLMAGVLPVVLCLAVLAGIGYGAQYMRQSWQSRNRIQNPTMAPENMDGEGDGPEGAFFPSSA
jgi:hypothetical protein